jgi:hypothetical protein
MTDRKPEQTRPEADHRSDEKVDWKRPETWPRETGGSKGPEPTRYGDWERNGRCTDF